MFVKARDSAYKRLSGMPMNTLEDALQYVKTLRSDSSFGEVIIANENRDESFVMSVCGRTVRVDWVNLGEGYNGDYNPNDPEDQKLLRFDVYKWDDDDWRLIEDASYCTCMPLYCGTEPMEIGIRRIHAAYTAMIEAYPCHSLKRLGEHFSHMG